MPATPQQVRKVLEDYIRACANEGLDLSVIDYVVLNGQGQIQRSRAFWDESHVAAPPGMKLFAPNVAEAYES